MSLFRRLLYGKRQDRVVDKSEWVFVETAPPPSPPPRDDTHVVVPNIEKPIPSSNPGPPPPPPPLPHGEPTMPMYKAPPPPPYGKVPHAPPPPPSPGGKVPSARPSGRAPSAPPHPPPPPPGAPAPLPPPGRRAPEPPPPPPPGASGWRGCGRAVPIRKSNLKPLHWSKLSRAVKDSLWEELQRPGEPQSGSEFDISELETLFCNSPRRPTASSSRPEKIQLINLRRANNTETMLTKIKMRLPDIVVAVLDLNEEILDVDQLENILKFCPTKEEMDQLENYTGDLELLGKCEQFFLELMKVPRMEAKLNVFIFKIQFKEQLEVFKKSLHIVSSACDEVRKSNKFKEIMKRIVYLMNTLNQGNVTGAADGFKLDTLLKLTDIQSSTSGMTLMHYLCKVLASKLPTLIDFHEDLLSLESATKIKLKDLADEMESLITGVKKVKQELDASADDGPVSRSFCTTVKEFIGQAEAEVTSVTNFYSVVHRHADELALYFGEDPAYCPFEQATQTLLNFVKLFQKCYEENLKADELERKKAENEAEMEKAKGIN